MGRDDGRTIERAVSYDPLPSQRKFHRSRARFKGFSGPVGSGKSAALCHEAIRLCHLNPGRMGLIAAPTYTMLRDTTQVALLEMLERNKLPFEFLKAENLITFTDSKSKILLRSLDEPERLRGTNLAWFGVDELSYAKEEAWTRLEARLRDPKATRLCGFAVWTPKGHDWVYRRFVKDRIEGYEAVLAKPFENRFLLDHTPDFYDRLKSSYDEKFYAQEVLGQYLNILADRVYHAFDPTTHVKPQTYDSVNTLFWALDFNITPMSSLIIQRDQNMIRVLDEIVLRRATTEQACQEFLDRFGTHSGEVVIYGDASGQRMQTSGTTDYEMVRNAMRRSGLPSVSIRYPASNPAVRQRVNLVNGKLRNADGEISIEVDPKCKELIRDFEEVLFQPDSQTIDKTRDPLRTHLSDALGYLIWQQFGTKRIAGEMNKPLLG